MNEPKDRIDELMKAQGINRAQIMTALDISKGTISNWLIGRNVPSGDNLVALAHELRSSPDYILSGCERVPVAKTRAIQFGGSTIDLDDSTQVSTWDDDTPVDDDEIAAPFYTEAQLAAGNGHAAEDGKVRILRFSRETLRREGIEPENVVAIKVRGNSMEPDIPDGATVAIDRGDKSVRDGKEYAVVTGELARIKRVYRLRNGGLRLHSINESEHPDEIIEPHEMDDVRIVGKVFWVASLRR